MCGLFDAPKPPPLPPPPPPEPPPPVFQAGSEMDAGADNSMRKGKSSLKNESVGLGIPTGG